MSKECTDRFDAGSRCRDRRPTYDPESAGPNRARPDLSAARRGDRKIRAAGYTACEDSLRSPDAYKRKARRNSAGLLTDRSDIWRKRRDSNPRYPFEVYTLSRRAPSTARTLFPDRPLRRTRASGDQTCRKVRKFLKIKNTGGAFARSARTLSLAGPRRTVFPLKNRTAPGEPPRSALVQRLALPLSMLSLPDINLCGRYFKSQKIGARPDPARRSVPDKSSRGGPGPIHRPAQIPRMQ